LSVSLLCAPSSVHVRYVCIQCATCVNLWCSWSAINYVWTVPRGLSCCWSVNDTAVPCCRVSSTTASMVPWLAAATFHGHPCCVWLQDGLEGYTCWCRTVFTTAAL